MSEYKHAYGLTRCPFCDCDLTVDENVKIETYEENEGNKYFYSRLDDYGELEDVEGVIAEGLHSDTFCANCDSSLNEHEIFD